MGERGGRTNLVKVRNVTEYLPPVIVKKQRRNKVRPHLCQQGVVEEGAQKSNTKNAGHDSGEESSDTAEPELGKIYTTRILELNNQKARNKVTGQNKEDGYA